MERSYLKSTTCRGFVLLNKSKYNNQVWCQLIVINHTPSHAIPPARKVTRPEDGVLFEPAAHCQPK